MGRLVRPYEVLGVALLIGAWGWASQQLGPARMPSPLTVVTSFFTILVHSPSIASIGGGEEGLRPHLWYTIHSVALGSVAGIGLGILVGLIMGLSQSVRHFLEPPIELIRTVPPLAAIPFFLLWFGRGAATQFALLVFYCFFRMVIYTLEAVRNVAPVYQHFALALGASRRQVFRTVVLPAIIPELTGGIRVILPIAWGLEVVAELMGARYGVGRVFIALMGMVAIPDIMAIVLWVALLASLTDVIWVRIARRITRWMPA
jgi:ABC-type nitrate/sulfonate/bicarbonate transport system permease component